MTFCNCNPKPLDASPHCGCRPSCDTSCACPEPFLGIEQLPDNLGVLRFSIDGKRADYDFTNLVYQTQSDTTLVADVINRLLQFTAERHTDTITARDLGALLHLGEIGDVDSRHAENGSILTYQKDNNCAEGCVGVNNRWVVWNALDNQVSSATYLMAFNATGHPVTLQRPASPSKQYLVAWDGKNQLSYITPTKAATKPARGGALYYDEDSNQIVYVEGA